MKPLTIERPKPARGFVVDLDKLKTAAILACDKAIAEVEAEIAAAVEKIEASANDKPTAASRKLGAEHARLTARAKELATLRAGLIGRPTREPHQFRLPNPIRMEAIRGLLRQHEAETALVGLTQYGALCLGAAWAHEVQELDTPWPADVTPGALATYAEAVQEELLDAGYSESELSDLADQVVKVVINRRKDHEEAEKLADFFGVTWGVKTT